MTDYQEKVISLMKARFGPAAMDIAEEISASLGIELTALDNSHMDQFASAVRDQANSLISGKEAKELYNELQSI